MVSKRFKLFKLYGFQVWADWSWALLAILVSWSLRESLFPMWVKGQAASTYWIMGISGALGLFLSIVIHEFAHSYVARRRGLAMNGITLFIFGGVAEMAQEPPSPATEFWMAIAGPAMSVAIGLISMGIGRLLGGAGAVLPAAVFQYLGVINLTLAVFNMIPAFPLDGGRVLRSVLWHFKGDLKAATRIASMIGSSFGLLLIALGLWEFLSGDFIGGVWSFLIGSFVRNASAASYQQLVLRKALEGEPVSRFMNPKPVIVPSHITVDEFVRTYVTHNYHKSYPVGEEDHVIGVISVDHLRQVAKEEWEARTVTQEAEPTSSANCISAKADAMAALELMQRNQRTLLLVIDEGQFEGIVTLRDMLRLISVKLEFGQKPGASEVVPPPVIRRS